MTPYEIIQNERRKAAERIKTALEEYAEATGLTPQSVEFIVFRSGNAERQKRVSIQSVTISGEF